MTEHARAVAQRLRIAHVDVKPVFEAANTIDSLCAKVERLKEQVAHISEALTNANKFMHQFATDRDAAQSEVERLTRWKSTNAPRLEALEGLLATAQKEASAGKEAAASLASEREANAILTAEVERLTKERAGLVQLSDLNADIASDLKAERDALRTQLAQAQEELHDERNRGLALLADAKEWQRQFNASQATIETLRYEVDAIPAIKEERDAAQADAARYRWLRKWLSTKDFPILTGRGQRDEPDDRDSIDTAIDAAMKGETK